MEEISYHILTYPAVRERERITDHDGGSTKPKISKAQKRKRGPGPNQPLITSLFKKNRSENQDLEKEEESTEVSSSVSDITDGITCLDFGGKKQTASEPSIKSERLIDQNHGCVKFIWYETGEGLETFALLESGLSNLWMKLLRVRDKTFGTKLAKNMLDSEQILTAEFVNLIGNNMGRVSIT